MLVQRLRFYLHIGRPYRVHRILRQFDSVDIDSKKMGAKYMFIIQRESLYLHEIRMTELYK